MRHLKIGLLTLAVCATAVVSVVAASEAGASSRHIKKHQHAKTRDWNDARAAGEIRTIAPPPRRAGTACPGNARAIDCTVWPPPFDDDPDRKATSSDGG
jgi:hypothetical protein